MSRNHLRQRNVVPVGAAEQDAVLTDVQLRGISQHRYRASGHSILEPYMQVTNATGYTA